MGGTTSEAVEGRIFNGRGRPSTHWFWMAKVFTSIDRQ